MALLLSTSIVFTLSYSNIAKEVPPKQNRFCAFYVFHVWVFRNVRSRNEAETEGKSETEALSSHRM